MFGSVRNQSGVADMKQADRQTRLGRDQVVSGWLENAYN